MASNSAHIPLNIIPNWNDEGLIPAVTQDADTGEVLMLAWMNAEALEKTLASDDVVYWSRSRRELWRKGATSGNTQRLVEARLDCDGDTLLLKVHQQGAHVIPGDGAVFYAPHEGEWKLVAEE